MKAAWVMAVASLGVWAGEARAQDSIESWNFVRAGGVEDVRLDPEEGGWTGTVRLFLGAKMLDETDWSPVEDQGEFAIVSNFAPRDWDIHLALDLRFASSEVEDFLGIDLESHSWEVNIGVRKVFDTGSIVRPYLGFGLAVGEAELEGDGEVISESGFGFWFSAGVDIVIIGPVSLGLELGISSIPIEIEDIDINAGGTRLGLTLGFSW